MKKIALVVAAGIGSRMQSQIPKQFLVLGSKPVLMHTIQAFFDADATTEIVLILHSDYVAYWQQLCVKYAFDAPHSLVAGGSERFFSVKNAIDSIKPTPNCLVAIHDGVRPLVSQKLINELYHTAKEHAAAIPVVALKDSIRSTVTHRTADRSAFKLVQTPQVFGLELLKKAYNQAYSPLFTDDASVVEALGQEIRLVAGEATNIKITEPLDMLLAQVILNENKHKT